MKVYIASDNIISSIGNSTAENVENILAYKSGIQYIQDDDLYPLPFLGAKLKVPISVSELAKESITQIIRQTDVDFSSEDCLLIISSTKADIDKFEVDDDDFSSSFALIKLSDALTEYFNIKNTPLIISNACISGVAAILTAQRLLSQGKYKNIVVVGVDTLSKFIVSGFHSLESISKTGCQPYGKNRDGLVLGEACASIMLTTERHKLKGNSFIIVEGGAITNDANHITGPSRTGDALHYALQNTMLDANISPEDISFINAHGTATLYNDEMESKALALSGLQNIPVNSLKPYIGHTLGAAGVLESILCFEQLRNNIVFGTNGFAEIGVPVALNLNSKNKNQTLKRCLKTASGFGGCNAVVSFALEEHANHYEHKTESITLADIASCTISKERIVVNNNLAFETEAEPDFSNFINKAYKHIDNENMKFYKMDNHSKLGYIATSFLLKDIDLKKYKPDEIGIVLANKSSSLDSDLKHWKSLQTGNISDVSPQNFVHTLPNIVIGQICIKHKIQGENLFFIFEEWNKEELQNQVQLLFATTNIKLCLYGWCDFLKGNYEAEFYLAENSKSICK